MGAIGLARTIAYAVGVLLSLITLGVSAGASAKTFSIGYVDYYWSYYDTFSYTWYRGILAFAILSFLYFAVSLGLSFFKKSTIFLSVIVDVSILGTLFIIGLSVTAWTTAGGGYFFPVGAASVAFGWLLTFFLLALAIFNIVYAAWSSTGGMDAWKSSLYDLESGNSKKNTQGPAPYGYAVQPGMVQPVFIQQQPAFVAQEPMQQGGFTVQPTPTGTSTGEVTSNYTGSTYPPQQPQHQQYTINLAQPATGHNETVYNVDIARPGSASLPPGAFAPATGKV